MIRKTGLTSEYQEVRKLNEKRYIINFDKVDKPDTDLCEYSQQGYYYKPTTAEIQGDVIKYTIQRYVNEGLEPPRPEDIDVSKYVID